MLRFINVYKHYPQQQALQDINFHIEKNEMVFLTGHSGAGKTTLLKLISLIETASSGQIFVDGRNLERLSNRQIPHLRRNIGIIFQNPQLLAQRSVFENVAIPLIIAGYRHRELQRRVRAALEKVGLLEKEKSLPCELSCGEQQRVGIARAIVNKPALVLADEPTGNLDPTLSMEIIRLFEAFNKVGVTVLIATHNLSLIALLNHRVITLRHGQLIHE